MQNRSKAISWTLGLAILASLLAGCPMMTGQGNDNSSQGNANGSTAMTRLQVEFDGLESLGDGFVYEGWLIVDGQALSAGRFDIDENGNAVPDEFEFEPGTVDDATAYVLTIEPDPDDEPGPSDVHVLAGDLMDGTAELGVGHASAIGDNFESASGTFILATPSTADDDTDEDQGIWYLDPDGPVASLVLPELPESWTYEGWIVGDDGPVSTGTFSSPDGEDSDGAGDAAGAEATPAFPGQDFIDPALSLIGMAAVISVEPVPDDSTTPFAIKPLLQMNIEEVFPPDSQMLENNAASLPTGTATLTSE